MWVACQAACGCSWEWGVANTFLYLLTSRPSYNNNLPSLKLSLQLKYKAVSWKMNAKAISPNAKANVYLDLLLGGWDKVYGYSPRLRRQKIASSTSERNKPCVITIVPLSNTTLEQHKRDSSLKKITFCHYYAYPYPVIFQWNTKEKLENNVHDYFFHMKKK